MFGLTVDPLTLTQRPSYLLMTSHSCDFVALHLPAGWCYEEMQHFTVLLWKVTCEPVADRTASAVSSSHTVAFVPLSAPVSLVSEEAWTLVPLPLTQGKSGLLTTKFM